jgi:YggT family protein
VNIILCNLAQILGDLVWIYTAILLIYAVVSWFPDLRRGRWTYYLAALVEPVLMPIRRIIPPMGGLDIAFLVLLLILQLLVRPALLHLAVSSCFLTY